MQLMDHQYTHLYQSHKHCGEEDVEEWYALVEEDLVLNHAYVEVDGYMEEVDANGLLNATVEYVVVTEEFGVVAGDVHAEEFV